MRIGINASFVSATKGGASFYGVNITYALSKVDNQNEYFVYCSPKNSHLFQSLGPSFRIITSAPDRTAFRLLWEQTVLPFYLCNRDRIDVLFCPNYTTPFVHPKCKTVVSIFDLSFFAMPEIYPRSRRIFTHIITHSVKRSDHVLAISKCTAKDIVKYVGDYQAKMTITYLGADARFSEKASPKAIEHVKCKYGIDNSYVLFVGFLEPRKNLERLLQAFAKIADKLSGYKLVIAGGKGWWYDATFKRVSRLGLKDTVVFTGYVEDNEVPLLYSGADLLAFVSLYEGFGIAALESITCGTPVLASNNSALPEVIGNAGLLVSPFSTTDIAEALEILLTNPGKLKELKRNCKAVADSFSWEKCATQTLEAFTRAYQSRR